MLDILHCNMELTCNLFSDDSKMMGNIHNIRGIEIDQRLLLHMDSINIS